MPFDLTQAPTQKLPYTVNDQAHTLTVGNATLSFDEARSLCAAFEDEGALLISRTPADQSFIRLRQAARKGDQYGAARLLVATLACVLAELEVQEILGVKLEDMPQRGGAADAARSVATVVSQEPPSAARDSKVQALHEQATAVDSFETLREGLVTLERQVAGNELVTLQALIKRIKALVEPYRHRLEVDPLLKRDLGPALEYLDGANEQGADRRKRNATWRDATEERLAEKIAATAREEGRRDASKELSDRLAGVFKDPKTP